MKNEYICNICKRELTSTNYYVYAQDLQRFITENKPPSVLYVSKQCKLLIKQILNNESICQLEKEK